MTNNAEPIQPKKAITYCHLPILFEFYNLHAIFLPLFRRHRKYFYTWYEISSSFVDAFYHKTTLSNLSVLLCTVTNLS